MILYRTTGPWGAGVGANLTPGQVDGNFYDVSQRVQLLELHGVDSVQITSITSVGNQLYFKMSDGTTQGPVTMPSIRWVFRGNWKTLTPYLVDDVVVGPDNAVYRVAFNHTSAASFDPGANDGQGHDYYSLLLIAPAAVLPAGGGRGDVLTKLTTADYSVTWLPPSVLPGGNTNQVLRKFSDNDGEADWSALFLMSSLADVFMQSFPAHGDYLRWDQSVARWVNSPSALQTVLTESSWAPVVGDQGAFMVVTNGSADTTIFIPNDDSQDFPIGSELNIHQDGTGMVTVVGDVGVAVLKHASFSNALLGQYATATAKKTAINEWRLFGLLAGA